MEWFIFWPDFCDESGSIFKVCVKIDSYFSVEMILPRTCEGNRELLLFVEYPVYDSPLFISLHELIPHLTSE